MNHPHLKYWTETELVWDWIFALYFKLHELILSLSMFEWVFAEKIVFSNL